jgi:tetratricopeptide (TPR) repeat protein
MGTKKQPATKPAGGKTTKSTNDGSAAVVVSSNLDRAFLGHKIRWGLIVLCGLFITVNLIIFGKQAYDQLRMPADLPTPAAAAKIEHDNVVNNPPAANASNTEKAKYYSKLMGLQAEAKDYKGAVDAFKKWEAADTSDITYSVYIAVAMYYHNLNDNKSALEELDKAAAVVPPVQNEDNGYFPDLILKRIDTLRKEYSS